MRALLFFMIVVLNFSVLAQSTKEVDSIKKVLSTTQSDSIKYKGYGDLSMYYGKTMVRFDLARNYADSIHLLAKATQNDAGMALAHYYNGIIMRHEGNFLEGIPEMEKYIKYHQKAGNTEELAKGFFQNGVMLLQIGDYEKSLLTLQKSHELYRELGNQRWEASLLHSMAHIYRKINNYNEAIKMYKLAIVLRTQSNDSTGLSMSTESLGNTYGEMGQYTEAEKYLKNALQIVKGENRPYGIASVSENLGNLYNRMGNNLMALKYHQESLDLRSNMSNKRALVLGLLKTGQTHWNLGNYQSSQKFLMEGLQLALEIGVKPLIAQTYKSLSLLYESQGKTTNAYHFLKRYESLNDSLLNAEKNRRLVEIETKYNVKQKEQQIVLLSKENELQLAKTEKESTVKNALLMGIISLVIIAGLLLYTLRQRLKNQSILAKTNEELRFSQFKEQLSTLEMKALRAQMNPHFLFNCMNSINRMILGNQNDEASSYLAKFSKLVRAMLENSEQPEVSLKQELQLLKSYIQLESIRFKNKIDAEIIVSDSINQEDTYIPSMLLQPFVENAIWHGLMHKKGKGKICLKIEEKEDMLCCEITDNGVGRKKSMELQKENRNDKKSMGIKITANRLAMLSKKKVDELVQIVDLKDKENNPLGTKVQISIPIL